MADISVLWSRSRVESCFVICKSQSVTCLFPVEMVDSQPVAQRLFPGVKVRSQSVTCLFPVEMVNSQPVTPSLSRWVKVKSQAVACLFPVEMVDNQAVARRLFRMQRDRVFTSVLLHIRGDLLNMHQTLL